MKALEGGAKLHLMFQSLCGSEKGLRAFGVTLPMLHEAWDMTKRLGQAPAPTSCISRPVRARALRRRPPAASIS
jgi:ethanolamine ammonia-lyase large subunit